MSSKKGNKNGEVRVCRRGHMANGTSNGVGDFHLATSKRDEDDLCFVFSTMEDFEGDGRLMNELQAEETDAKNLKMVLVEVEALAIATVHDSELEEIIELSLEGVTISETDVD